jgi:multicomponent Na+:H+ antiporter subunit E
MHTQMLISFVCRLLPLAALWWVLTGGDTIAWLFGGPVIVVLAAWRSDHASTSEGKLRFWQLLQFVPYFVARTLLGSCDVAWRAIHVRLPITPVVRGYTFRLPEGSAARVFFANCLNLLPGTLTACWQAENELQVHVLTDSPQAVAQLRRLERRVALLFGHEWVTSQEDASA